MSTCPIGGRDAVPSKRIYKNCHQPHSKVAYVQHTTLCDTHTHEQRHPERESEHSPFWRTQVGRAITLSKGWLLLFIGAQSLELSCVQERAIVVANSSVHTQYAENCWANKLRKAGFFIVLRRDLLRWAIEFEVMRKHVCVVRFFIRFNRFYNVSCLELNNWLHKFVAEICCFYY